MSAIIGRLYKSATEPMEVLSMAQRLCFGERMVIEAMTAAGSGPAEISRRLGRHRSTVQRELASSGGRGGYRAGAADQRGVFACGASQDPQARRAS
ncbi:MAG: helix-turn-helix domain-containing protein [Acidimicrobiaceae bacterium]|nr:helix-turn-helix domain-containing protein [Acidimicrobiaceae bacterium]MYA75177.1 helix-turn-helix domain-containing protein [Acidimicrobiaceae bacterium]MYC42984.1 helix-turn-helix domain-containing protein [Acidimicrobiaceae bacterium]MYG55735.1 helix-turn-helix domain-containing protein [Acidimicrobiaceae bacterium]MYH88891.1 helix-turn-helix domain-containing protein [Acidimicrobiaceae bacterium]